MASQTQVFGCPHHQLLQFIYVCKTCNNELLCQECVTDSHNGHTLGKLTEYIEDQKRVIQQFADKISESDISQSEGDIQGSGQHARSHGGIEGIRRQGKRMKEDIDDAVDRLEKKYTMLEERNKDMCEKNGTTSTLYQRGDINSQLDMCQEVLTSGTTANVITLAREIGNLQKVDFKPGTISKELLERMIGKVLFDGEDDTYILIPQCDVLFEFQTSFPYNTCQAFHTVDGAWLSYKENETIYRVDLNGKVNEKITCQAKVSSISVSPTTGTVWLCVRSDRSIREITMDGDIVTRFHVDSTPRCLCITSDGMVVVGMKGGIQLYTTDGRAVSAGTGGPCKHVAAWPHHMTSCTLTGDIAAVDSDDTMLDDYMAGKKSDRQPHIIVMDKHLNLRFYCKDIGTKKTQGTDIQSSKSFPYDVCFDGVGDILVSDLVSKSVLLVDRNTGHVIMTVYTSDGPAPWCISLHDDGSLWVGHRHEKTKVIKYR